MIKIMFIFVVGLFVSGSICFNQFVQFEVPLYYEGKNYHSGVYLEIRRSNELDEVVVEALSVFLEKVIENKLDEANQYLYVEPSLMSAEKLQQSYYNAFSGVSQYEILSVVSYNVCKRLWKDTYPLIVVSNSTFQGIR